MADSRRSFLAGSAALTAVGILKALGDTRERTDKMNEDRSDVSTKAKPDLANAAYTVRPIGVIHNRKGKPVQLELFEKYSPGLLRMEHCKRVMVIWWFHKNDSPEKRAVLKVHPRGKKENPLTGVFATHSPVRPNLIALTQCKVLEVKGSTITVDKIDAFDGTPILDLKSW